MVEEDKKKEEVMKVLNSGKELNRIIINKSFLFIYWKPRFV